MHNQIITPSVQEVEKAMEVLLEGFYPPPPGLHDSTAALTRRHDDTDGEAGPEHEISVGISRDGDAWVLLPDRSLRFRGDFGGGMSPRVRRALIVLAEAIRRDNEECPQRGME